MYFLNYGLPETWLEQGLKSALSQDQSKSNMVNALKHCAKFRDTSFTIFIDHSKGNCVTKSLCY